MFSFSFDRRARRFTKCKPSKSRYSQSGRSKQSFEEGKKRGACVMTTKELQVRLEQLEVSLQKLQDEVAEWVDKHKAAHIAMTNEIRDVEAMMEV
jgi:hypothetical protein